MRWKGRIRRRGAAACSVIVIALPSLAGVDWLDVRRLFEPEYHNGGGGGRGGGGRRWRRRRRRRRAETFNNDNTILHPPWSREGNPIGRRQHRGEEGEEEGSARGGEEVGAAAAVPLFPLN